MKTIAILTVTLIAIGLSVQAEESAKVIHVYVALCDNRYQGIVPVPAELGNGQDPAHNLYWGALYGVKTFFNGSASWTLIECSEPDNEKILQRCVFSHDSSSAILIADAYDGASIRECITDFVESSAGRNLDSIEINGETVEIGGGSDLLAYIGHNGLMEFNLASYPTAADTVSRDVIALACISKSYFERPVREAGANPLLWTTGFMAPEAYTLEAALEGWLRGEQPERVRQRAAEAYSSYQKCGQRAALRLLVSGY